MLPYLRQRQGGAHVQKREREKEREKEKDALVTITNEKIRPQPPQIQRQMPHPMRPIHQRQHPLASTNLHQPLKRHPHPGQTHHRIEQRNPHPPPLPFLPPHHLLEPPHHLRVRHGVRILDPYRLRRRRLADVLDRLLARAVNGAEVHDPVAWVEAQAAEDRVDAGRGVGEEDDRFDGDVQEGCEGEARGVEEGRVGVADEVVRAGFGEGLHGVHAGEDGRWVGAEGAWEGRGGSVEGR